MAAFLLFATAMASFAGATILCPGTALDRLWQLNPRAHRDLAPFGKTVGVLFLLLAVALALAAAGWFRRRIWGWRLAVTIIAMQLLGDLGNALSGHPAEGAIGVLIAGLLLFYLSRKSVRLAFQPRSD
jgi:hypothetical protein